MTAKASLEEVVLLTLISVHGTTFMAHSEQEVLHRWGGGVHGGLVRLWPCYHWAE